MANTKIQIKRTSVTGRTPNTTNISNTAFIDAGELAVNLTDGKLFSSNGSVAFEVGANLTNLRITGGITANGSTGANGNVLVSDGANVYWSSGSAGPQGPQGSAGVQGPQGTQGALKPWSRKTTTYTAVDGDRLIADTSGGAFTITLPATPSVGAYLQITDGGDFSINNLTVARNGSTIEGIADDVLLDIKGVTYEFIYDGSTWEVTGTTGAAGSQGPQGAQGSTGPQGPQGNQGLPSTVPGPQGFQGSTGPQGPQGGQGSTGSQGPQGQTGAQGPQGNQGSTGPQGPQGIQGSTGPQGITGPQGPQGRQGSQGNDGGMLTAGTYVVRATKQGGSQTVTSGADAVVTFGDDFDSQGWFASNKFQPTTAGYYTLHAQVWWDAAAVTNNQTNIQLRKNGSTQIAIGQTQTLTGSGYAQVVSTIEYFNGTSDYVEVTAYTGNTTSQNINSSGSGTYFTAALYAYGPQGAQGPQGNQGATGPQGPQGIQGATGPQGPQGITGPQGPQGRQGATGPQGPQGQTGPQGPQGNQGATGPQGPQGQAGAQGPQGNQGATGPQGPQGQAGAQGPQGNQGATGPQGPQGQAGAQGPQGNQGATGPQGPQGIQGSIGPQGPQGIQGSTGPQGPQGFQGNLGPQGPQGIQGSQGYQGSQGSFGGATFAYTYVANTTNSEPGDGFIRFSNTNYTTAANLYIDQQDGSSPSANVYSFLQTIDDSTSSIKGHFVVTDSSNNDNFTVFAITGTHTHLTHYFSVPVSYLSGNTAYSNNTPVSITFARTGDVGDTGPQGPQGNQGTAGSQGPQGSQGSTGPQGTAGPQGPQGFQGTTGPQGPQGNQGAAGPQGAQGSTGPQGPQGNQGTTGPQGNQGSTGPQGPQGNQGTTGPQGVQGSTGPQGPQGFQGTTGPQGPQGRQGSQGDKGGLRYDFSTNTAAPTTTMTVGQVRYDNAGITSVTNLYLSFETVGGGYGAREYIITWDESTTSSDRGQIILKGNDPSSTYIDVFRVTGTVTEDFTNGFVTVPVLWLNGSTPPNGEKLVVEFIRTGDQGSTGPQGPQGSTGSQGPQGNQGSTGPQGPQGSSGPQGAQGSTGPQGPQGIQGSTGPQGPQGIQGSTGPQGPQGSAGPQGPQGIQGSTGPQGPQGIQGSTGPQGPQGSAGPQGPQGFQGTTGPQGPQGSAGPQGSQGNQGTAGPSSPKAISIMDPTASEDITLFYTNTNITVSEVRAVLRGSGGQSVTYSIRYDADRNAAGTAIVSSNVVTNTTTGTTASLANSGFVAGNTFVWLETSNTIGTVSELAINVRF